VELTVFLIAERLQVDALGVGGEAEGLHRGQQKRKLCAQPASNRERQRHNKRENKRDNKRETRWRARTAGKQNFSADGLSTFNASPSSPWSPASEPCVSERCIVGLTK